MDNGRATPKVFNKQVVMNFRNPEVFNKQVVMNFRNPEAASLLNRDRRADIQGLRAVAVLAVVAFHAGLPLPGGFTGVDVFFVISGFVITSMLAREWAANGRLNLRAFYLRRFKRLTPALALMAAVVVTLGSMFVPVSEIPILAKTAIGAMLLGANIVIATNTGGYFDAAADSNALLNTWSLSVEEQFYLFFPAVLLVGWVAGRKTGKKNIALFAVAVVAVISFALTVANPQFADLPRLNYLFGFYSPVTRVWEFAAGSILALVGPRLTSTPEWIGRIFGLLAITGLITSMLLIDKHAVFPGIVTLLPVIATILAILVGTACNAPITHFLESRWMVWLGDRSYSWYLWHWPAIALAAFVWPENTWVQSIAALFSLLVAQISYQYVEQPFRNLKVQDWKAWSRFIFATSSVPLIFATSVLTANLLQIWPPLPTEVRAASRDHISKDCDGVYPSLLGERCVWNAQAKGYPIYLLGDSEAGQFSEAVIVAGDRLGRPVKLVTQSANPIIGTNRLHRPSDASWHATRDRFAQAAINWLLEQPSGTVILATTSTYWHSGDFQMEMPGGAWTDAANFKIGEYKIQLENFVRRLNNHGHRVLLIAEVPKWEINAMLSPMGRSSESAWIPSKLINKPQVIEAAPIFKRRQPILQVQREVADSNHSMLLDLWPQFCDERVCEAIKDGTLIYRDGGHISAPFSRRLSGIVGDAISCLTFPESNTYSLSANPK